MYGTPNPAEELVLLAESGQPYYVHINDNDGRWDWDYFCGTKHLLEYAIMVSPDIFSAPAKDPSWKL